MAGGKFPGGGRYTIYVPDTSTTAKQTRIATLRKMFNARAGDQGAIYGKVDETDNGAAADVVSARAKALFAAGVGDAQMFPTPVKMDYSGAPDLTKPLVNGSDAMAAAGGPSNPYVPNLYSPGPAPGSDTTDTAGGAPKTNVVLKVNDPIPTAEIKPLYGNPGDVPPEAVDGKGTTSPSTTSATVGTTSIGHTLTPGKSSK